MELVVIFLSFLNFVFTTQEAGQEKKTTKITTKKPAKSLLPKKTKDGKLCNSENKVS